MICLSRWENSTKVFWLVSELIAHAVTTSVSSTNLFIHGKKCLNKRPQGSVSFSWNKIWVIGFPWWKVGMSEGRHAKKEVTNWKNEQKELRRLGDGRDTCEGNATGKIHNQTNWMKQKVMSTIFIKLSDNSQDIFWVFLRFPIHKHAMQNQFYCTKMSIIFPSSH